MNVFTWSLTLYSMGIISRVHNNFVFKVEIPKHELELNEAATEEDDHTQFEVDMVMFNISNLSPFFMVVARQVASWLVRSSPD